MCRSFLPFLSHILNSCRLDGCSTGCSQYAANIEASYLRFLKCCLPMGMTVRDHLACLTSFRVSLSQEETSPGMIFSKSSSLIPSLTASSSRSALRPFSSRVDHCSLARLNINILLILLPRFFFPSSELEVLGST